MRKKILYIQHAGELGGSCISLLYTLQGLDQAKFEPVVALIRPNEKLVSFYENAGFQTIAAPGIYTFEHTTASHACLSSPLGCWALMQSLIHWRQSMRLTLDLAAKVNPDLVHLNSVVLVPSAMALAKAGIPFVWQVREAPVKGYFGRRTKFMSSLLKRYGKELIFISDDDCERWVQKSRGVVVANFVDLKKFTPDFPAGDIREKLKLPENGKTILFLGGISPINGLQVLLEAICRARESVPGLVCIAAGMNIASSGRLISRILRKVLPFLGTGVPVQKIEKRISELNLEKNLRILPFQKDIRPFIAVCDVLVFPSTVPHFARPVIEAAAMGKPSIGSDIGGVNGLIENGQTGILVKPGSVGSLTEALKEILSDPEKAALMGQNGIRKAQTDFNLNKQIKKITGIYDSILNP
ncbi:MAG: glycosyltransferase family 4 protein [Victivallaceae bacterium]|nr:glycosyltransferase family 4 protein [Victivallaceae bacterium]